MACRPGETASFEATRVPFDPHRDDDGATPPPTSLERVASSEPRICTTIGRACSGRVMPTPKRELQMPTICTKRSSRSSCSRLLPRLCRSSEVRRPRHRHRPHRGCGPRTAPRGMARKRNERAGRWRVEAWEMRARRTQRCIWVAVSRGTSGRGVGGRRSLRAGMWRGLLWEIST